MRGWWGRNFLLLELLLVLGAAAAFIGWDRYTQHAVMDALLKANRPAVYAALASIFGSLLGFVITAVSILLAVIPTERFNLIRESAHHQTLWRTYKSAIRALGLATAASLVALVLDRDDSKCRFALYATTAGMAYAGARIARCVWILEKVIGIVAGQPAISAPSAPPK